MSWLYEEYARMMNEAYENISAVFDADIRMGVRVEPDPVPNTFMANPVPREGYIDARRDDGCVALITGVA